MRRDQPRRLAQRRRPGRRPGRGRTWRRRWRARSGRAAPAGRPARARRRRPAGCRRSHGSRPVGLDGDVGLGDEVLVAAERPQRGLLPGRVAVEGEDHLAAELLVVVEEPAQHPRVVVAERRAAGGHRGRRRRRGGRPSRRCSPRRRPPATSGRCRGGPGRCRRAPGSSCRSAVSGVLRYFASIRSSSKIRRAPKPIVSPLASRIGHSSRPRNRSYAERPTRDQPGRDRLLVGERPSAAGGGAAPRRRAGRSRRRTCSAAAWSKPRSPRNCRAATRVGRGQLRRRRTPGRPCGPRSAVPRPGPRGRSLADVALLAPQLHAVLVGQPLDGLGEGEPVDLHQEGDDVAALAGSRSSGRTPRPG